MVSHNWKVSTQDRFGLQMLAFSDYIGDVRIEGLKDLIRDRAELLQ